MNNAVDVDVAPLTEFRDFLRVTGAPGLRVFSSGDERDFTDAVEDALNYFVDRLESGRAQYSKLDEIGLSQTICELLNAASIPAAAEEHSNGHVDITVRHPRGLVFKYLGECKIWQSVPYHLKGMSQLLNDYSSGRHQRGCCLEFVHIADCAGKLQMIRDHLDAEKPLDQDDSTEDHPVIKGGFVSRHTHASGWTVEVLHLACNLHDPA